MSEAYVWQRRVASENALLGLRDTQTYATVNLVLYDSSPVFESVALARAAGTFTSSTNCGLNSIYMIDKAYTWLDKELERIETRQAALSHDSAGGRVSLWIVHARFPSDHANMLDGDLIQVTELQTPWREYFDETSLKKKRDARDFEHELPRPPRQGAAN